jgi:hypothetical protein
MVTILERGHIFFFYRPRVNHETVEGPDDVQRLSIVLLPRRRRVVRRLILGRKRLPEPEAHERFWGFVDEVAERPDEIEDELDREQYQTATRGLRMQPAARPAGEGVYGITRHEDHTHLVHQLELPRRPGEVQRELNIEPEASFIITVKNPEVPSPPGLGNPHRRVELPQTLRERFAGRRFIAVDPPALLDVEGIEFVLIGAAKDVDAELGIDLKPERESLDRADIFRLLKLEPEEHPVEPLVKGEWR